MPLSALCVYFFIAKLRLAHSIIRNFSGGWAPSPRSAVPGPPRAMSSWIGPVMDKVGDPWQCEQSERATENEKFTVSEEILNFLVMGWLRLIANEQTIAWGYKIE